MSALTDTFTAIANKIRAKLGVQTTYTPAEMPDGIDDVYTAGVNSGSSATKVGTAVASDVLTGKTFTNASSVGADGSMPNQGNKSFSITNTSPVSIPAGYYNGSGSIQTSGMMVTPTAAASITSNGSHNVTNYATANVSVTPTVTKIIDDYTQDGGKTTFSYPNNSQGLHLLIIIRQYAAGASLAPSFKLYGGGTITSLGEIRINTPSTGSAYSAAVYLVNITWQSAGARLYMDIPALQDTYGGDTYNSGHLFDFKLT